MSFMANLSHTLKPSLLTISYNNNNNNTILLLDERKCEHFHLVGPRKQLNIFTACASKSGDGFNLNSVLKKCGTCRGQGAIDCAGCKGTGRNKKNGNIFERWKCYDCQGFGLKGCPECGKGGLTPEQRGER